MATPSSRPLIDQAKHALRGIHPMDLREELWLHQVQSIGGGTTPSTDSVVERFHKRVRRQLRSFMHLWGDTQAPRIERTWRTAEGASRAVSGRLLPAAAMAVECPPPKSSHASGQGALPKAMDFLRLAVYYKDLSAIRWALESGFDANQYSPEHKNTPLGLAAFMGYNKAVQCMLEAGADPLMILRPEHFETPPPDNSIALGSSLLHRVLNCQKVRNLGATPDPAKAKAMIQTAHVLLDWYPRPLPRTTAGKSPVETATPSIVLEAVVERLAREHAKELRQRVAPTTRQSKRVRL